MYMYIHAQVISKAYLYMIFLHVFLSGVLKSFQFNAEPHAGRVKEVEKERKKPFKPYKGTKPAREVGGGMVHASYIHFPPLSLFPCRKTS